MANTITYINDKDNRLYSSTKNDNLLTLDIPKIDVSKFTGFNNEFTYRAAYVCDDEDQMGYATLAILITDATESFDIALYNDVFDDVEYSHTLNITVKPNNLKETADLINSKTDDYNWVKCYVAENDEKKIIAFKAIAGGDAMNTKFYMKASLDLLERATIYGRRVSDSNDECYYFIGGCDDSSHRIKINASDYEIFKNEDRYILNYISSNNQTFTYSHSISIVPYINTLEDEYIGYDEHTEMLDYMEVVLENRPYINSKNQVCVYDRFNPSYGKLSIFPVKDFYFNTFKSIYAKNNGFADEVQLVSDANPQAINNKSVFTGLISGDTNNTIIDFADRDGISFDPQVFNNTSNDNVLTNGDSELAFTFGPQNSDYVYETDNVFNSKDDISKVALSSSKQAKEHYLNTIKGITIPLTLIQAKQRSLTDAFKIEMPSDGSSTRSISDYLPKHNLFGLKGDGLDTEYDYYTENINPNLCFDNRINPVINSWCMRYTDAHDQPYRLNTSKIFRYNNLSPFINNCDRIDIAYFTHDGVYLVNEFEKVLKSQAGNTYTHANEVYRYVDPSAITRWAEMDEVQWIETLSTDGMFDKLFNSFDGNKRINKHYSEIHDSKTILHGIQYNISDYVTSAGSSIAVNPDKYEGYKFTNILIPLFFKKNIIVNSKPTIIINDTDKCIIIVSFFNTLYGADLDLTSTNQSVINMGFSSSNYKSQFIRSFIYAGGYRLLNDPYIDVDSLISSDNQFSMYNDFSLDEANDVFKLIKNDENKYILTGKSDYVTNTLMKDSASEVTKLESVSLIKPDGSEVQLIDKKIVPDEYVNDLGMLCNCKDVVFTHSVSKKPIDSSEQHLPVTEMFKQHYDQLKKYNAYTLMNTLESGEYNIVYTDSEIDSDSDPETDIVTLINIMTPDEFDVYNVFEPSVISSNTSTIIGSDITLSPSPSLDHIARYSGYYHPLAQDIFFFNNKEHTEINTAFKDSYGSSFTIGDMFMHKYSDHDLPISKTPIYPLIEDYCITSKDMNVFASSFDPKYFTSQISLSDKKDEAGTRCMVESNSLMGSKVIKLPRSITVDSFNEAIAWDQSLLYSQDPTLHLMYRESNDSTLSLHIFNQNILTDYLIDKLRDTFEKYIDPKYSFGRIDEVDDDCLEYIKQNIIKRYTINSIKFYHVSTASADNNSIIENDYTFDQVPASATTINTYSIKTTASNRLDREIIYSMENGNKESFYLRIEFKLI